MKLKQIRQEIDAVDKTIVTLLKKRLDLVSQVIAYKQKHHLPILDTNRENEVLGQISQLLLQSPYQESIVAIFTDIMAHSRAYQSKHLQEATQHDH